MAGMMSGSRPGKAGLTAAFSSDHAAMPADEAGDGLGTSDVGGRTPDGRTWQVLSRRTIVEDRWISLHAEHVRTGRDRDLDPFYVLDESDWVCALPILPDGRILVVEQYRHGAQALTWELPAGDIDAGEDPVTALRREVAEETGHAVIGDPVPLGVFHPEPARNRSRGHAFLVTVATGAGTQALDEGEDIRVLRLTSAEVDAAMDDGRFSHAVHVAAVLRARQRGLW